MLKFSVILSKAGGLCFVQALRPEVYDKLLVLHVQLRSDPIFAFIFGVCAYIPFTSDQRLAWPYYICTLKRWAIGLLKTIASGCGMQLFGHIVDASPNFSNFYAAYQQINLHSWETSASPKSPASPSQSLRLVLESVAEVLGWLLRVPIFQD